MKILITPKAYRQIQAEVRRHPGVETGGAILGFRTPSALVITNVTGPGPSAVHLPDSIHFDESYYMKKVRQLESRTKTIRYIGDWHNHPYTKLKPSKVDQRSFRVKSLTHYRTAFPVMIIAGPEPLIPLQGFLLHGSISGVDIELVEAGALRSLMDSAVPY